MSTQALVSLLLFLAFYSPGTRAQSSSSIRKDSNTLLIEIRDIRSSKGQIGVLVFNKDAGFPSAAELAIYKGFVPAREGVLTFEVKGIATGKIAVAVMHDENNNSLLDTNFLGIPKEGTGVSNNATSFFGPPDFADCSFDFLRSGQKVMIDINY